MTEFVKRKDGFQVWMEFWDAFDYEPGVHPAHDTALPICELSVSGVHGTSWRGLSDNDPRAVVSKESLAKLNDQYNKRGIELVPHNIPWGVTATLATEIALAIEMLDAVPKLIIDFELGPEFWHEGNPPGPTTFTNVAPYMQAIRAAHPSAWIGVIFDPNNAERYLHWAPYVDAVYMGLNVGPLSSYGGTANPNMDPIPSIQALAAGAALYAPTKEWYAIIDPMDLSPERFELTLKYTEMYGINISVWRRGIVTTANWDVLRNHKKNVWT